MKVLISWAEATPSARHLTLTVVNGTVKLTQAVAADSRLVELNLAGLPAGNYVATLSAGNLFITGKLVVVH